MTYTVVSRFMAKEHDDHIYKVGDVYPLKGKRSSKARIEELSTSNNKYKHPFIRKVGGE